MTDRMADTLAVAITRADELALDNLHTDWARESVGRDLAASLRAAGYVHRDEMASTTDVERLAATLSDAPGGDSMRAGMMPDDYLDLAEFLRGTGWVHCDETGEAREEGRCDHLNVRTFNWPPHSECRDCGQRVDWVNLAVVTVEPTVTEETPMTTLQAFLVRLIRESRVPQRYLAEATNMTEKHVSEMMNGHSMGTLNAWQALLSAAGVELSGFTEERP